MADEPFADYIKTSFDLYNSVVDAISRSSVVTEVSIVSVFCSQKASATALFEFSDNEAHEAAVL